VAFDSAVPAVQKSFLFLGEPGCGVIPIPFLLLSHPVVAFTEEGRHPLALASVVSVVLVLYSLLSRMWISALAMSSLSSSSCSRA
jgi:hypothetical protein